MLRYYGAPAFQMRIRYHARRYFRQQMILRQRAAMAISYAKMLCHFAIAVIFSPMFIACRC